MDTNIRPLTGAEIAGREIRASLDAEIAAEIAAREVRASAGARTAEDVAQELYATYVASFAANNCEVDAWDDLDQKDHEAWCAVAAKTMGVEA